MKTIVKYLLLILLAVSLFFNFKSCGHSKEITPLVDTKPIKAKVDKELKQKDSLKTKAVKSESVASAGRNTWRTTKEQVKKLPCDSAIKIVYVAGDSMAVKDSTALSDCKKLNQVNDSIISHLQLWIKADSVNYKAVNDSLSKLQPRQIFYLGMDVNSNRQVYFSAGFDTKKGAFFGGYDPFNKQVRVGAYVKIKGWKRR